jgi:AhpD family alkylhydroperoxidase
MCTKKAVKRSRFHTCGICVCACSISQEPWDAAGKRLRSPTKIGVEGSGMATVRLWTDEDVASSSRVKAVFDDIRATRKTDFVNNFWRALANQPGVLERTWASVKEIMVAPGALDPLTKELIYIAVSATNACSYCAHSHTAAAREGNDGQAACGADRDYRHGERDERACVCPAGSCRWGV